MRSVEATASYFFHISILATTAIFATLSVVHVVFALLAFVIASAYVLVAKRENVFLFLFFLVPFAYVFKLSVSSSSLFTYLQLIVVARFVLTQRKFNFSFVASFFAFFAFLLAGSAFQITVLLKQAVMPLLIYFFFCMPPSLKSMTLHYTAAMTVTSFAALFKEHIPNMEQFLKYDPIYEFGNGDTLRFAGFYTDPNYYSFALLLCLIGVLLLYTQKEISGVIAYPVLMIFSYFGAQTASKSFILDRKSVV